MLRPFHNSHQDSVCFEPSRAMCPYLDTVLVVCVSNKSVSFVVTHVTACGHAPASPRQHAQAWADSHLSSRAGVRAQPSDVVGSMIVETSEIRLAGKPPWRACSLTSSSFGAM